MKFMYDLNSRVQDFSSAFQMCPLQQKVLFPLNIKLHNLQKQNALTWPVMQFLRII